MRVLIVEDQANVSTYLKQALTEQGYAVDLARTGQEALDWAEAVPFDLIVLDIMLPGVDGVTVCRRLRRQGHQAEILMLTARDAVDDRVTGLDAGADDYLVKPFELKELLARLRALARRRTAKTSTLVFADLTLEYPYARRRHARRHPYLPDRQRICHFGMFDARTTPCAHPQ